MSQAHVCVVYVELHDVYCANTITDNFKARFSSVNKSDFMITTLVLL